MRYTGVVEQNRTILQNDLHIVAALDRYGERMRFVCAIVVEASVGSQQHRRVLKHIGLVVHGPLGVVLIRKRRTRNGAT